MHILTISPIATPLVLKPGIDPRSACYSSLIERLPPESDEITVPHRHITHESFDNLEEDGYDLRLMEYRKTLHELNARVCVHVYPTGISVAEIEFDPTNRRDATVLEEYAKKQSKSAKSLVSEELNPLLKEIGNNLPRQFLSDERPEHTPSPGKTWIARTLVLSSDELHGLETQRLVHDWLKHTIHPEDAGKIVRGELDYSMTWLNYVIIERDRDRTRRLISAMIISQYFYASQEALNNQTQAMISTAYLTKEVSDAERMLSTARTRMQMLRIQFGVQMNYLNRGKRRIVDEVMQSWDFEALVTNGTRMSEACSARINELMEQRRKSSAIVTDLILVAIGFLVIIDVALSLTEYSREVMSRPVLEYTDASPSLILAFVASIETDHILLGGAVAIAFLLMIYGLVKKNK